MEKVKKTKLWTKWKYQEKENLKPKSNSRAAKYNNWNENSLEEFKGRFAGRKKKLVNLKIEPLKLLSLRNRKRRVYRKREQSLKGLMRHQVDQHMHKHMKRCSVLLISREMQVQNTMRYHTSHPLGWLLSKQFLIRLWKNWNIYAVRRNVKCSVHCGQQYSSFSENSK